MIRAAFLAPSFLGLDIRPSASFAGSICSAASLSASRRKRSSGLRASPESINFSATA